SVGEVTFGALAVVLERDAVAVVLPVLCEQDQGSGVRRLQRQDQRERRESDRGRIEAPLFRRKRVPRHPRGADEREDDEEPGGAHRPGDTFGGAREAVAPARHVLLEERAAAARELAILRTHHQLSTVRIESVIAGIGSFSSWERQSSGSSES